MAGRTALEDKTVKAAASTRMFSAKGRRTFVMVKLKPDALRGFVAVPVETGASGAITTLAKADGFVEIPENQQFIDSGEEVTVTLLKSKLSL
jgi:molybdopterin biosynthesis enzyme